MAGPRTCENPAACEDSRELVAVREGPDRLRQVRVGRVVARHGAADARQDCCGNTSDRSDRTRRDCGMPNSRIARRPPGGAPGTARRTRPRAAARCGCRTRSSRHRPIRSRPAGSSRRRAPAGSRRRAPRCRTLSRPCVSIAPEKSTPTTRAAPRRARADRDVRRAGADVEQPLASRSAAARQSPGAASSDRGRRTAPC